MRLSVTRPKRNFPPKVEKYNEFMLKAARKIQRHMPWLPRRKRVTSNRRTFYTVRRLLC